jgi:hypothetical protein
MNVSYIEGHDRASSILFQRIVSILRIFMRKCEVQLEFITECDLFYEDLGSFFPSET